MNVQVQQGPRANDFLVFSVVLMVICCVHGNILSVLLTIPALICSIVVQNLDLACNFVILFKHVVTLPSSLSILLISLNIF